MDDSAVIASAKCFADFLKRVLSQVAAQIHRDLARYCDVVRPASAEHIGVTELEVISYFLLNRIDGKLLLGSFHEHISQKHFTGGDVKRVAGERGVAAHFNERSFKAADVLNDVLCDEIDDFVADFEIMLLGLFAKNRNAGFEIGSLNIGY